MPTVHLGGRRSHTVKHDKRTALTGGREPGRRVVLVRAGGVAGYRDQFRTHSASLHEPFTSFFKGWQSSPNWRGTAGHAPEMGRNKRLRRGVAAHLATGRCG